MTNTKVAFTVKEASAYSGIGQNTLRKLIKCEVLPVVKIGAKILIRAESLDTLLKHYEGNDLTKITLLSL